MRSRAKKPPVEFSEEERQARLLSQAEMLINRVKKNRRHRRKWAKREGVSCYRLYDRDIPEIPMTIDDYEGRLYASLAPQEDLSELEIDRVGQNWLEAVRIALDVPQDYAFLKLRQRQKGSAQYTRVDQRGARFEVNEAGLKFWVNLSDYLDTGLFLDHRTTRDLVANEAKGTRFLNLFAYTGSFTVYAAAAAAMSTTTVDSTPTYLRWAADNLALNGLSAPHHELVRSDVGQFLQQARIDRAQFDLVVLDPPTFSNSKGGPTFDVRRHHALLFEQLSYVMPRGGVLYFSNNARKFKLHDALSKRWHIEEITEKTTTLDFSQRRAHRCWRCVLK